MSRPRIPTWSRVGEEEYAPRREIVPWLGLNPNSPQNEAERTMPPPASQGNCKRDMACTHRGGGIAAGVAGAALRIVRIDRGSRRFDERSGRTGLTDGHRASLLQPLDHCRHAARAEELVDGDRHPVQGAERQAPLPD